ncbi:MAG: AMP-binding protein, partial [Phenylobacterium sp.]|nr:AMP-binding protein [Phenylobacterium sp.]
LGYWRQPELTAQLFRDGWVRTGDVGRLDADGFLRIVDRLKDMIVSGGENVYTSEVENALCEHPAVDSCAVIGVPHPLWGEAVHAVVVLRHGHSADEAALVEHCRQLIGGYKCPKSITFRDGPLPLSGVGKVMKHELRNDYMRSGNLRRA